VHTSLCAGCLHLNFCGEYLISTVNPGLRTCGLHIAVADYGEFCGDFLVYGGLSSKAD